MPSDLQKRSIPIAILAFMQRAAARLVGLYKSRQFEIDVDKRSKEYLNRLNKDEKSLPFKIALENLRIEYDLLMEESAVIPEALELQLKVVELSARHEIASQLVQVMFVREPAVMLFNAILAETMKAGASRIQIDLVSDEPTFPVRIMSDGAWIESGRIPTNLAKPIRGVMARVTGHGYKLLAPHFDESPSLPADIGILWVEPNLVEINLNLKT